MSTQTHTTDPKKICSACGTADPINHRFIFIISFIGILGKSINWTLPPLSSSKNQKIINFAEKIIFSFFHLVGIVKYSDDMEKASGRSKVIWEEAQRRGIFMQQVIFLGKPVEHYKAKVNGQIITFQSLPIPPWLPQRGYEWADDKLVFARKLREAGLKSPETRQFSTLTQALRAFDSLSKPIIVKPQSGSRSRHTTTNINTKEQMADAFRLAREITFSMVAQEHLYGSVYRATVVNNVLVGFFRGDQPQVTGDGKSTIAELITEKNKNRHARISEILITKELINFIKRQNYTLESILPEGLTINLIAKTGRFYGSYTKEMLPEVHPKMYEIFKKAGEVAQIPVAGFDLIIEDPTADPDTQRWGIIECNTLPFIDLHYFALEGEPVNIAKYIWDLWDTQSK